jgi:uncharacterized protein (TIGR02145 family)
MKRKMNLSRKTDISQKLSSKRSTPIAKKARDGRLFFQGALSCCILLMLGFSGLNYGAPKTINISGGIRDSLTSAPITGAIVSLIRNRLADTTKTTGNFWLTGNPLSAQGGLIERRHSGPALAGGDAVRFNLRKSERVTIRGFSLEGKLLNVLDEVFGEGMHTVSSRRLCAGLCLYQVTIGGRSFVFKSIVSGEKPAAAQRCAEGPAEVSHLSKQTAAPTFDDTILVKVRGYEERRLAVTKLAVFNLKIKLLKSAVPDTVKPDTVKPDTTKPDTTKPVFTKGDSIVDIDGNVYKTVVIGTQRWMAENLKTTKFNDGSPIANILDGAEWKGLTTPAYCYYSNDSVNGMFYGALYNWYAVDPSCAHKLAPKGWHVATDDDWSKLETYLGGWSVAGGKMKAKGTNFWRAPNTDATNSSGFTALPGGDRTDWFDGVNNVTVPGCFLDLGYVAWWWSSTSTACRNISQGDKAMYHSACSAFFGASVRCVKD